MSMAAITSDVADTLQHVLADWTEKENTWKKNYEEVKDQPNALELCPPPTINPSSMLPGLERPKHWLHSLKRNEAWFEKECDKQLQEEKNERDLNTPSSSKTPSTSSSMIATPSSSKTQVASRPSSPKRQRLSLN